MLFVALVKEKKKPAGRSDIKIRGGTKWSGAISNSNSPPPPQEIQENNGYYLGILFLQVL